jgi:hypothetical protein
MQTSNLLVKFFAAASLLYLVLLGSVAGAIPRSISLVGVVMIWLLGRKTST